MRRRREWYLSSLALAALAVSILWLGGGPRWAQATVAVLVAAGLVSLIASRRVADRISPLLAMIGVAIGLTALQLVPLPEAVIGVIDPVGAALRAEGSALVDIAPWQALARDPAAALRGLAFLVILSGVAVIALRISRSDRGRYWLLVAVVLACTVTALVTAVHSLFGITDLYGFYEPKNAAPHVLGPLINQNHLGCLMALGSVVAIGLAMHRNQPPWVRACWVGAIVACGTVSMLTLSRGAMVALAGGALVAVSALIGSRLTVEARPRRERFMTASLPIGVVAACCVVIALYMSAGGIADQLSRTSITEISEPRSKFAAWRSAAHLIEESPWLGVGRGGFESSFTRHHPASALSTFSHVENEYVQAIVDWGLLGGIFVGIAAIWFAVAAFRRWREGALAAGALGALAVVILQSNFDFGVELLGIAVPITAVAATLTYVPTREAQTGLRRIRTLRIAHVAALLLAAMALFSSATSSLAEDHDDLVAARSPTIDDVRASLERHPLDYYGYALASQIMAVAGNTDSVRVLNHALRLHPTHPGLHLMSARILVRAGLAEQAAIEYAMAIHATPDRRALLAEVVARFPPELAAKAIPADDPRVEETVAILRERGHARVGTLWLTRVVTMRPNDLRACATLFALSINHGDLEAASATGRRCRGFEPSQQARLDFARALFNSARYTDAIAMVKDVEKWSGRIDDRVAAWLILCDSHAELKAWDEATRCLRRLDAFGDISPARRGEITQRIDLIAQRRTRE
jgi:O-antigen ligase